MTDEAKLAKLAGSWAERFAKLEKDYDLAEKENNNLRAVLAWADTKLSVKDHNKMVDMMDKPIEKGGVSTHGVDELNTRLINLICDITGHFGTKLFELKAPEGFPPFWFPRAEYLLSLCREYEPKRPLMQRVDGRPNVFRPVRKGDVT